jgi:hypothetical protein
MATASSRWSEALRPVAGGLLALLCVVAAGAAEPADNTLALTLRPGDTLIGIGEQYLEPTHGWRDLQRLNRIADPRRLRPGASLRIPLDWMRWSALPVEVVFVQGSVTGSRGPLAAGMVLQQGDSFDTGAGGSLTLRFADGALAVFAPPASTWSRAASRPRSRPCARRRRGSTSAPRAS